MLEGTATKITGLNGCGIYRAIAIGFISAVVWRSWEEPLVVRGFWQAMEFTAYAAGIAAAVYAVQYLYATLRAQSS